MTQSSDVGSKFCKQQQILNLDGIDAPQWFRSRHRSQARVNHSPVLSQNSCMHPAGNSCGHAFFACTGDREVALEGGSVVRPCKAVQGNKAAATLTRNVRPRWFDNLRQTNVVSKGEVHIFSAGSLFLSSRRDLGTILCQLEVTYCRMHDRPAAR